MVRTTIRIDESLLRQVKQMGAQTGRTFTDIVHDALREVVARSDQPVARKGAKLPTFRGRGLCPGVDLNDAASLLDRMELDLPLEKRR